MYAQRSFCFSQFSEQKMWVEIDGFTNILDRAELPYLFCLLSVE